MCEKNQTSDPFFVANMYYANLVQPIEQYQQFNAEQTTEQAANEELYASLAWLERLCLARR